MAEQDGILTLGDALPMEQARVRELILIYAGIGPSGEFAVRMMEQALIAADRAVMRGDLVAMLNSFQALKGFTT